MSNQAQMEMPQYQCHKKVHAPEAFEDGYALIDG